MSQILFKDESYQIIGACFEVYNTMGHGFLEAVYQECLEIEFKTREIHFAAQQALHLHFKDQQLSASYVPDFVCFDEIIVEIKGVGSLTDAHRAQLHNYLSATGLHLGILVNFGSHSKLTYERIVR